MGRNTKEKKNLNAILKTLEHLKSRKELNTVFSIMDYDSDSATMSGDHYIITQTRGRFSMFQPGHKSFSWMAVAMLGVMLTLVVALFVQVIKLITERNDIEAKIAHLEAIVVEEPAVKIIGDDNSGSSIVIRPPHPRDYDQNIVLTPSHSL